MWSFFQNINESIIFRFICWLGKNSLLILVIHAGIIVGMKPLNKLFIQFDSSGLLQVFVVSAITLVGSVLSGKLFDRINISKFIFGTKTIYRSFTK
jgi:fucose 4-O-acetylase-like acetyltransferase